VRQPRACDRRYALGSYQQSPKKAFENAARLMGAGAQMVKLEAAK